MGVGVRVRGDDRLGMDSGSGLGDDFRGRRESRVLGDGSCVLTVRVEGVGVRW